MNTETRDLIEESIEEIELLVEQMHDKPLSETLRSLESLISLSEELRDELVSEYAYQIESELYA